MSEIKNKMYFVITVRFFSNYDFETKFVICIKY